MAAPSALYPEFPFSVRTLFARDASSQEHLGFGYGAILSVTAAAHEDWWTATDVASKKEGLIPSRRRCEQRGVLADYAADLRGNVGSDEDIDLLDKPRGYQVVEQLVADKASGPRPVVLIAPDALREAVRGPLAAAVAEFCPVAQPSITTTAPEGKEQDGYDFLSEADMGSLVGSPICIQAGEFEGHRFALALPGVDVHRRAGKVVFLDLEPVAAKRLEVHRVCPIYIALCPSSAAMLAEAGMTDDDASLACQLARSAFHNLSPVILEEGNSLADLVAAAAAVVKEAHLGTFWAHTYRTLPLNKQLPREFDAVVKRGADGSFGLTVAGRIIEATQNTAVFVHEVKPNSSAAKAGLESGMQIMRINEADLTQANQSTVTSVFRGLGKSMMLKLRRLDPEELNMTEAEGEVVRRPVKITSKWEVKLRRSNDGFGMRLTSESYLRGVRVAEIFKDSPAEKAGTIKPGNVIIEINGVNLLDASHQQVVEEMRKSKKLLLLIGHDQNTPDIPKAYVLTNERNVDMAPDTDNTFGVNVTPASADGTGMLVESLAPGSRALNAGVQVGDIILALNGADVRTVPFEEASRQLQACAATGSTKFTIATPLNPDGRNRRSVVLKRKPNLGFGMKLESTEVKGTTITRVSEVTPFGAAEDCGKVFDGDLLTHVNGRVASQISHDNLIAMLRELEEVSFGFISDDFPTPYRRTVELSRERDGFGMKIQSRDHHSFGTWIQWIDPDGPAARTGGFFVDDVILDINGKNMLLKEHAAIVEELKAASTVSVTVSSNRKLLRALHVSDAEVQNVLQGAELDTTFRYIVLHRGAAGFGMRIICDETKGLTRVSGIIEGGAASETGQIFLGDIIHEVNGTPIRWKSYSEVVRALSAKKDLHLLLTTDESELPTPSNQAGKVKPAAASSRKQSTSSAAPAQPSSTSTPAATAAAPVAKPEAPLAADRDTTRMVQLVRDPKLGFGMRLVSDDRSPIPGTRVAQLVRNAPAERLGQIFLGDVIVSIDGQSVVTSAHDAVYGLLTDKPSVELVLQQPTLPAGMRRVILDASTGAPLGLAVSRRGDETLISRVDPGSMAAAAGIALGEALVEVNGTSAASRDAETINGAFKQEQEFSMILAPAPGPEAAPAPAAPAVGAAGAAGRLVKLTCSGSTAGLVFNPAGGPEPGLSVLSVEPSSAAEAAGICDEDLIVEVNGQSLAAMSHAEAVRAVHGTQSPTLVVTSPTVLAGSLAPSVEEDSLSELSAGDKVWRVVLQRQPSGGLGLKVQSIIDESGSVLSYVSEVTAGGAAQRSGKVLVGSVIVAVNGKPCDNCAHTAVVGMLKEAQGDVTLDLRLGAESEC